jgi:hypothetical protein
MKTTTESAALRARLDELAAKGKLIDFSQPQQDCFSACLGIAGEAIGHLECAEADRDKLAQQIIGIDEMLV